MGKLFSWSCLTIYSTVGNSVTSTTCDNDYGPIDTVYVFKCSYTLLYTIYYYHRFPAVKFLRNPP